MIGNHFKSYYWMIVLLCGFFALAKSELDLPIEEPVKEEILDIDVSPEIEEQELEKEEKKAIPTPTPSPVQVPLRGLFGNREYTCLGILVLYAIIFLYGRQNIKNELELIKENLLQAFKKDFFVVPDKFQKQSPREYAMWITGRDGYAGALLVVQFPPCSDPIGLIYGIISGQRTKLHFEFLVEPRNNPQAMLICSREKPYFQEDFNLKESRIKNLKCFSDFGSIKKEFLSKVEHYLDSYPYSIESLEITDQNHFKTQESGKFVAQFDINIVSKLDETYCNAIEEFTVGLADQYVTLALEKTIFLRNQSIREKLRRKKEEGKKDEQKLTPEQIKKQQEKAERRERNKYHQKFKVVK